MKTTALACWLWLACAGVLLAQPNWEAGLMLGGAFYQGDLVETVAPNWSETKPALGAFARFYLSPAWSMRVNLLQTEITGDDSNFTDPVFSKERRYSFRSQVREVSLLLEWDPLGKRRYPSRYQVRNTFSPFVYIGGGVGQIDARVNFGLNGGEPSAGVRDDQGVIYPLTRFSLPAGLGLRLDLGRKASLGVAGGPHYLFTDRLDGVSSAGNPDTNDWLWTGGLHFSLRFAPKDSDGDGIPDKYDACPRLAGSSTARGCPDRDGDGVEDAEDVCPDVPGLAIHNGCPDSDGDGIPDHLDRCPFDFGFEDTQGCPDRDNDCIADLDDKCPDEPGLPEFQGCPDSDGDGIPDYLDACPLLAGEWDNGGCPFPDSDCDGVLDRDDDCPLVHGGDNFSGCPDSDGDGVPDHIDRCPDEAGPPENDGCPILGKEELELIAKAQSRVQFRTGSDVLLSASLKVLDELVELMRRYPHYSLTIKGYTDNRGKDEVNLRLSKRRAKACHDYLLSKGISPNRMSHEGYGAQFPIGDNNTEEGRRLNRRVEFHMEMPDLLELMLR